MGPVERGAAPVRRAIPERGVGDEAVQAAGTDERAQLLAGPRGREMAPGDGVKARVPVPLVPVARRRRAGEAIAHPVGGPPALAPVGPQDPLGARPQPKATLPVL